LWGFARALLMLGIQDRIHVLCVSEVQRSIEDSVNKLLENQFQLLGIGNKYVGLDSEIRGKNGTKILYSGLGTHTVDSIKSFEGCDYNQPEVG
jgi:phage terminase large subunit